MQGLDLHHFMAGARFAGVGTAQGALVSLGRYPGMIEGSGSVAGEIYELRDPAASIEALDELEEFDPANPETSEYLRTTRDVRMDDGSVIRAWLYIYNRDPAGMPVVAGGDWRSFATGDSSLQR